MDGVAYIFEKTWWRKVYDSVFGSIDTTGNRKLVLLTHLPKWKGFHVNESREEMTATDAIVQLDRVVGCLFTEVWVKDSDRPIPERKKPAKFNIKAVSNG